MDQFRQGSCTQCKSSFRVPATFSANRAKCPKCGGAVDIGPVQGAAPAAAPVKPVPAAVPQPKAAVPQPKTAASAPAKPEAAAAPKSPPAAPKPSTPGAAAGAHSAPSVRTAAAAAADKVKSGAAAKPGHKAKDKQDEPAEAGAHGHHHHVHKKKSPLPVIIGFAGIVAFGAAGYWYFGVKLPAETAAHDAATKQAEAKRAADLAEAAAKSKAEQDAANAAHEERLAQAEAAKAAAGGATAGGAADESAPKTAQPKAAADDAPVVDDINLLELQELGKYSKSSDEEWAEYQKLAATFVDLSAGAKSTRAGKKLEDAGRAAMPALLNQMRLLNLATEDGFRRGDMIQKTLEHICHGRNFGWSYGLEPKNVVYNKKAIKSWFKTWGTAGEDDAQWAGLTKQGKPAEGEEKPAGEGEKPASGLDDF